MFSSKRSVLLALGTMICLGGCPPETIDSLFGTNLATPTVESVSPTTGSTIGGTKVTIVGSNFDEQTGVLFGSQSGTSLTRVNANVLEVNTPPGSAGMVDLVIVTGDGQRTTMTDAFQYVEPAPRAEPQVPTIPLAVVGIEPDRVPEFGGTTLRITGSGFAPGTVVLFGGFLGTQTEIISDQELLVTAPAQVAGPVDVVVRTPDGSTTIVAKGLNYVDLADSDAEIVRLIEQRYPGGPRVVSAVATNNTGLRLTFNEPIRVADLKDLDNYEIVIPGGGFLMLDRAAEPVISSDQTVVNLVTLSQADATYRITVTGIRDLSGNRLAAPDILLEPAETTFRGIAPIRIEDQIDTDGDGFADWFEMLGWSITIELTNGQRVEGFVTSDPYNPDTDGDGLNDAEENRLSLDPRTDDTDADQVSDWDETRELLSDPTDQDTDDDGFADKTELEFRTSITLADTDGDQFSDFDEIVRRNRNPRLADLPLPQIRIGSMNITLDERFSYTDERGVERSEEVSSQVEFTQADTRTFSQSSTRSNEATDSFSQELQIGASGEIGKGKDGISIAGQATVGSEQSRGRGYSSTVSEESSRTSQETYSEASATALATSERREVTRSVEAAQVALDVTIVNAGDVAFNISNLEISARVKRPNSQDVYVPLATLLPTSGNNEFSLGPFQSQRGPFNFSNSDIFPAVAQDLVRSPRATLFDVANFDITDEYGRNFAFTSEQINDVTAGITIDLGDGRVETYRVATASRFDRGRPLGITMREALTEIIGLEEKTNEGNRSAASLATVEARRSFGTAADDDGVQFLTRIRDVQTALGSSDPAAKFWAVLSSDEISDEIDFGDLVLKPGSDYLLWFVQDADRDGLFAREEFLAGSSDEQVDTDGDGLTDFFEARVGWLLATPGNTRRVFSNPGSADTDRDLVPDGLERRLGSDPRASDTDGDGLRDDREISGYEVVLLDADNDPSNNPSISVQPYSDAAILQARDIDGVADSVADPNSDDVQLVPLGQAAPAGTAIVGPGLDGILDSVAVGDEFVGTLGNSIAATATGVAMSVADPNSDDVQVIAPGAPVNDGDVVVRAGRDGELQSQAVGSEIVRRAHRALFATDPVARDTDFDTLPDGREEFLGSRPNVDDARSVLDSDFDGLTDQQEEDGWLVNGVLVKPDKLQADTDRDGLPDAYEWALLLDPTKRDTDGDGLNDIEEYDPLDPSGYFDPERVEAGQARCDDAVDCLFVPADNPIGTNPREADTDGDELLDGIEVDGWTVIVVGSEAEQVDSDPLRPDTDGDGLTDHAEYLGANMNPPSFLDVDATHPRLVDTDSDGASDACEVNQNQSFSLPPDGLRRSGVVPDQLVLAQYTRFEALGDCDNSSNEDYVMWLEVEYPTAGGPRCATVVTTNNGLGFVGAPWFVCGPIGCLTNVGGPCGTATCSGGIVVERHLDVGVNEGVQLSGQLYFVKPISGLATMRAWVGEVDGSCDSLEINTDFGASLWQGTFLLQDEVQTDNTRKFEVTTNPSACNFRINYTVIDTPCP